MDIRQYDDTKLMNYWREYNNRHKQAMQGDKRRYNTKCEITFTNAMRTLFATELRNRAYCLSDGEWI